MERPREIIYFWEHGTAEHTPARSSVQTDSKASERIQPGIGGDEAATTTFVALSRRGRPVVAGDRIDSSS